MGIWRERGALILRDQLVDSPKAFTQQSGGLKTDQSREELELRPERSKGRA